MDQILLIGVDALLLIGLVVLAFRHRKLRNLVLQVSAHRPMAPKVEVIKDWQQKLKMYPEGTPKHRAYKNRLREVGALKD